MLKSGIFGDSYTPAQSLIDCLERAEEMKEVVVVWLSKDDQIFACYSDASRAELIGMLDVMKHQMARDMLDAE